MSYGRTNVQVLQSTAAVIIRIYIIHLYTYVYNNIIYTDYKPCCVYRHWKFDLRLSGFTVVSFPNPALLFFSEVKLSPGKFVNWRPILRRMHLKKISEVGRFTGFIIYMTTTACGRFIII